jgi:multidrug resistance efflux pump
MSAEANVTQAEAQLRQAQANLERTRIVSPVEGYVTNLLAQPGGFVSAGANTISVVDANSFWADGYFEETNPAPIRIGDPARTELMGRSTSCAVTSPVSPAPSMLWIHTRRPGGRQRQSDLHMGAPGPAHSGSHPYR